MKLEPSRPIDLLLWGIAGLSTSGPDTRVCVAFIIEGLYQFRQIFYRWYAYGVVGMVAVVTDLVKTGLYAVSFYVYSTTKRAHLPGSSRSYVVVWGAARR